MTQSLVYALDFDGVICDSAVETAITGWEVASVLWKDMPEEAPLEIIQNFREVRPVVETGYESILAMRMIYQNEDSGAIFNRFPEKTQALMKEINTSAEELKALFGARRDQWIADDLDGWIANNPLFPGVAAKLQTLAQFHPWYVVTTKQERFVKQILQANGVDLMDEKIFGLDRNMSKVEVLTKLLKAHPGETIHFIEDRLPSLLNVIKHEALAPIKLVLARWGYNTSKDKADAVNLPITSIELHEFLMD